MSTDVSSPVLTVADYLLHRIASLGVRHLFGVPGDYNLAFLDNAVASDDVRWVGTANELGAAYAADGYARARGFAALLTTFGVGELSAVNGVAGSYTERVPLLHITIGPSQAAERAGAIGRHTAADADYDRFVRAHAPVVCAAAVLHPENAASEIDRVLATALRESRPGYLRIPLDVAAAPVAAPEGPLRVPRPVDQHSRAAFRVAARKRIETAESITVLADFLVDRYRAHGPLAELIDAGRLPWATLSTGRNLLDETAPGYAGVYSGALIPSRAQRAVDDADLLVQVGVVLADATTGGFTHGFDPRAGIDLQPHCARVDGELFDALPMDTALEELAGLLAERPDLPTPPPYALVDEPYCYGWQDGAQDLLSEDRPTYGRLTQDRLPPAELWGAVSSLLRPATTVLAEQGSSFFGMCTEPLPAGVRFIAQPLWGAVGYTLPALLGAQLADPSRRGLLLIGDGSAQMTIQELGTIARQGLTPVILLVNSHGCGAEQAAHGAFAPQDDIALWDWTAIPAALGAPDALVRRATTTAELAAALEEADRNTDRMVFIEACTDMTDMSGASDLLSQPAANV